MGALSRFQETLTELLFLDAASVQVLDIPADVLDIFSKGGENVRRLQTLHKVRHPRAFRKARLLRFSSAVRPDCQVAIDNMRPHGEKGETAPRIKIRGSVEGVKCTVREIMEIVDREKRVEEVCRRTPHFVVVAAYCLQLT